MKEKAIEICNNITQTLNKMKGHNLITNMNPMFKSTRVTKEILRRKRRELRKQYNIQNK
jgi:hypothetical protein